MPLFWYGNYVVGVFMHKKTGFTLVEVIIATIILVISIIGGTAFFFLNRNNLSFANRQRLATWAAVYKIEELKNMNYSALALLPSPAIENNLPVSGYSFTRTTTITDISGNYKQATVKMDWEQPSFPSSLRTLSLTTYIAERL